MHHGEFATLDWILLAIVPPLLGSGIGLLFGMARSRVRRAAIVCCTGGAIGGWAGVIVYYFAVLPNAHDQTIFTACVLAGFFLGAIPLGFLLAGPPHPTNVPAFRPASGPVGSLFGGILGLLIGIAIAYLSTAPGSGSGLEYMGYFLWPLLGAIIGAASGLIAVLSATTARSSDIHRANRTT